MTAAHAYELPPHSAAPVEAVEAAAGGEVVYLTHNGQPMAAIVPLDVAAAGAAAIQALEDADDLRVASTRRTEGSPTIPLDELLATYAEDVADVEDDC